MKRPGKRIAALLCALLLTAGAAQGARADGLPAGERTAGLLQVHIFREEEKRYDPAEVRQVKLTLNGEPVETDVPAILDRGRTLVPVRALAEAFGAEVDWRARDRQVAVTRSGTQLLLTLGAGTALVNGTETPLPDGVGAQLVSVDGAERTLVPLRFLAETLGAGVEWDGKAWAADLVTVSEESPTLPPEWSQPPAEPTPTPEPAPTPEPTPMPTPTPEPPVQPAEPPAQPPEEGIPALAGYAVVLDAGHGGPASGAVYEGILEKDLNLSITLEVARILEERGCQVYLTRWADSDVGLYERCDMANGTGADIFVSIHANASVTNLEFQGTFTYCYPGSYWGEALAEIVQAEVVKAAGSIDRGILTDNFVVLRETRMPAVLVETGFMSCHEELMRLCDPAYQSALAQGIANGVERYFTGRVRGE